MANDKSNYHIYSHTNPDIEILGDFVAESDSIGIGLSIPDLLLYEDENGNKNIDNLISLYTQEELNDVKISKLLAQIRSTKPTQQQNITQTSTSTILLEGEEPDNSVFVEPKNAEQLNNIIYDKSSNTVKYFTYQYRPEILTHLAKLHNESVRLLFKKFIYRVNTETFWEVLITDSGRTKEQQHRNVLSHKSESEFSYHVVGLALDINLVSKISAKFNLTKKSLTLLWKATGVVRIAEELGLTWGGTFTNVLPDPVHFDAQKYFVVHKKAYLDSIGVVDVPVTAIEPPNDENPNLPYLDLPIKMGTVLALPFSSLDREVLSTETNQVVNTPDFEAFHARQLVDLLSNKGYVRSFVPKTKAFNGTVKEIYPYISVWVWSRALSISNLKVGEDEPSAYEHRIINITPYILSLNTTVADNGGSFNIGLSAITADLRTQNTQENSVLGKGWKVKEGIQKASTDNKGDYVSHNHIHYIDENELKRERMYFEKVIQANDLVFIRFERLELEDKRKNLDELETISINDLPNQVFDMIALVDNVQQITDHAAVDVTINVTGRDLVKLLIEDGVYFYPSDFSADGIFSNTGATNTRLVRFDGNYLNRFQTANKTIDRSLKFIINNLGSIEICPSNLFDGYINGRVDIAQPASKFNSIDKRSKAYQLIDPQRPPIEKQHQENNDKKEAIIKDIARIRKSSKISKGRSIDVFSIIYDFLKEQVVKKTIVIENEKIKSWKTNKLPISLMDTLVVPERIWLDQAKKPLILRGPVVVLEGIYKRVDKNSISDPIYASLKNLDRKDNLISIKHIPASYSQLIKFDDLVNAVKSPYKKKYQYDNTSPVNFYNEFPFTELDQQNLDFIYSVQKGLGKQIQLGVFLETYRTVSEDIKDLFNDIYNLIINETSQVTTPSVTAAPKPLAGIWQIIKLVVDSSVKDRRIIDPNIGNENGSILNAFRKVCQDPFCEFFTDTYGDQFYFIARKKPFDQKSLLSVLDGRVVFEPPTPIDASQVSENESQFNGFAGVPDLQSTIQNVIVDIEEEDVLSDSLNYSTEAYSWYRLQLANLSGGDASSMSWAYLKGIYFNEFADIYGSKPLDVTTSYIPYSPIIDKNKKVSNAYFIKQGVFDLKYMIESHAYLPFTRMGTIILNGDRRIKKGTFVRFKATNEIYYVDAVTHSYSIDTSIDRTTTLQVSRGMVERFIKGVNYATDESSTPSFTGTDPLEGLNIPTNNLKQTKGKKSSAVNFSYFNICQLDIDERVFENSEFADFSKTVTKQWKVNKSVFNFFLKRLQFAKNDKEIFDSDVNLFES